MPDERVNMDEARRDLYRALDGAFGHDRPGGSHHHLNVRALMRELERFIDAKLKEKRP